MSLQAKYYYSLTTNLEYPKNKEVSDSDNFCLKHTILILLFKILTLFAKFLQKIVTLSFSKPLLP